MFWIATPGLTLAGADPSWEVVITPAAGLAIYSTDASPPFPHYPPPAVSEEETDDELSLLQSGG